jgi:hypothetical protein
MALNRDQIKLLQTAVRAAGIRTRESEGRYRLLLSQYKQPNRKPVESSLQLSAKQLEDILAICEAHGWQCPGKAVDHFRKKVAASAGCSSTAQQNAIFNLAGDMGWSIDGLDGFIGKMTKGRATSVPALSAGDAHMIIEVLKRIMSKRTGVLFGTLEDMAAEFTTKNTKDTKEENSQLTINTNHCESEVMDDEAIFEEVPF